MAHPLRTGRRRHRLRGTAGAVALLAAALLAGCSSSDDTKTESSASPSSTESASPSPDPSQEAKDEILAVYRGMWKETAKIYSSGSFKGSELTKYAGDKALAKVRVAAIYYQDNNLVVKGEPKLSPKVTALSLGTDPKTATVVDCVDSTNFVPENKDTGKKSELDGDNRRHTQTSKAQWTGKAWLIIDSTIDKDSTC
ncbi:hypothetical protein OOK44_36000 [Streptomyces cellulosae]|uniref:Lipoprotein n=1 Tax=Streptomyces althioticus TaxID=83380 RepID=A0ABZ1YFP7_9ACTN|nr:hypothetical protein [Streptomyces cellulosae]WTB93406.1 hypothetical protein OIE99_34750 [Streptomyces cellulosae]WTC60797.1 hypothetical protein OH715_36500 [Streptomyces cellulosae]